MSIHRSNLLVVAAVVGTLTPSAFAADPAIRFNRDIRPILTDKCFACHGPDAKTVEGDLRLDLRDEAIKPNKRGNVAITPGDPRKSELVKRIFATSEEDIMPPLELHKPLKGAERELLKQWVAQGAQYEPHWAYTPLKRPTPPAVKGDWARNDIDKFVAARHAAEGVSPAAEADRVTLIRRLSFDLTGLAPTPAEVDAFVSDTSADAYEKLVDRLLASPRFGERMAVYWLDLVRYADTVGYHGDQNVSVSPYRDYVINAFNANMPYDRFVREQLAGDLLPDATLDQQVASGYNRLNQTTEEGGSQAKEYLAIYFADRVRNVSQTFMGATMGCAQCHDHKYDPFTTKDFYSFGAFFADLEERGVYSARKRPPEITVPVAGQREKIAAFDTQIAELKAQIEPLKKTLLADQPAWEKQTLATLGDKREVETAWIDDAQSTGGASSPGWAFVGGNGVPVHSGARSRKQTSGGLVQHYFDNAKKPVTVEPGMRFYAWVYLDAKNPPKAIMLQFNDGNWEHRAVWGGDDITFGRKPKSYAAYQRKGALPAAGEWVRLEVDPAEVGFKPGAKVKGMAFTQFGGLAHWDAAGTIAGQGVPASIADVLNLDATKRTPAQSKAVRDYYTDRAEPIVALRKKIVGVEAERNSVTGKGVRTLVSKSVKPRVIRILPRGNWMDDSGEIVQPAIPAFQGSLDTGGKRATRLDLANWLTTKDNVFTSRTMANRLWYLMFGRGICSSVDDFGGQGVFPSHPDLLDWLAVEFVEGSETRDGWDIKHTLKTIVTSATYRQSSKPTPKLRADDPQNELLARQGRFRVDAESVRDNALAVSGLLVEKVGGVSAKPYQPPAYYAQLNFPRRKYAADKGENQYRRGVYTHWQRQYLHPMLKAFDAPSREECTAARSRSNTPLQALSLLNDPSFVEAARVFAARIAKEGGESPASKIEWAYREALSRKPHLAIAGELRKVYNEHLVYYRTNVAEAKKLIASGDAPAAADVDPAELAAWTGVARVILNLHETITRY